MFTKNHVFQVRAGNLEIDLGHVLLVPAPYTMAAAGLITHVLIPIFLMACVLVLVILICWLRWTKRGPFRRKGIQRRYSGVSRAIAFERPPGNITTPIDPLYRLNTNENCKSKGIYLNNHNRSSDLIRFVFI